MPHWRCSRPNDHAALLRRCAADGVVTLPFPHDTLKAWRERTGPCADGLRDRASPLLRQHKSVRPASHQVILGELPRKSSTVRTRSHWGGAWLGAPEPDIHECLQMEADSTGQRTHSGVTTKSARVAAHPTDHHYPSGRPQAASQAKSRRHEQAPRRGRSSRPGQSIPQAPTPPRRSPAFWFAQLLLRTAVSSRGLSPSQLEACPVTAAHLRQFA